MPFDRAILHIVPAEPWGGIQALVPVLAGEQRAQGADVRILTLGPGQRIRAAAAAAGMADRVTTLAGPTAPARLFATLLGARGAIVHSHCEPVWASAVIAAARSPRWVSHAHVYPDDTMTRKKRASLRLQRAFAARHIAISHSVGRAVLASGLATHGRLDVVANGVRVTPTAPRSPDAAQPFSVGFIGRVVAEKGVFDFVALAALFRDDPGFTFAVFGDGADLDAARAAARAAGLGDRLAFHGYVEDIDLAWATLDAAAIFSQREPFGLVFLEAALRGAATVSYANDSGGSEVAAELNSAHRVAQGDVPAAAATLRTLAADRAATAAALAIDRATIAERFDIATMARGVAAAYARLDHGGAA